MPKYVLKYPDKKVYIYGVSLQDATQEQLREIFDKGDIRFIIKEEEPKTNKRKKKDKEDKIDES